MANGNGRKGLPRASGLVGGGYGNKSALKKRMKAILGMSKRPTTAGQAVFGDVDVTGAQTTAREQEKLERARINERLGEAAGAGLRGLVGAQFTEQERQRVRNLTGAQMTEAERRRLGRGR